MCAIEGSAENKLLLGWVKPNLKRMAQFTRHIILDTVGGVLEFVVNAHGQGILVSG